ncbi:resolvase [Citrobacter sp. NCU1]|uniref:recombinase family protein n=1 Tax=Citrobacter sp. NCU1 TaxID=2026683 RepID=UPI001391537A|nr:recombinase family protein [Citrobacter sp. NCU1]NDO82955.1 resolvase [Citrobacter sp. NCU1]
MNQNNRTFAYCRVSTGEQDTENQVLAMRKAGYDVRPDRVISETISGGVVAVERPGFKELLIKLEPGDKLVVLKLDRLGRDNIDVQQTVKLLTDKGVNLICLDLPVKDLTTPEGQLMLQLIASFAEFEKARIRERTLEGQARARKEGKIIGRPVAVKTYQKVQELKAQGLSQSKVAEALSVDVSTVKRHWKEKSE